MADRTDARFSRGMRPPEMLSVLVLIAAMLSLLACARLGGDAHHASRDGGHAESSAGDQPGPAVKPVDIAGHSAATPSPSPAPEPVPQQRTLVIVHPPALRDAAVEWADYRTQGGWQVTLLESPATMPAADADEAARHAIRQTIIDAIRSARLAAPSSDPSHFAVMLLGDDDTIPPWHFEQTDPMLISDGDGERAYISDQPYQFADDVDEVPDYPLGRVPTRTNEQALALLNKIREHESAPTTGLDRSRVTYIAGEARFGPFDVLLETLFVMMVDQFVPDAYELTMTYAKPTSIYCPPPSRLTQTVLARMTEGAALFNYLGHGHPWGLDSLHWNGQRYPILRVRDLQSLDPHAMDGKQRPVAFMSCCSVGHFDLPDGDLSLAEAMLFHPAGPIAVIAGSRVTHPYANTVLQKDITAALLRQGTASAGLLDLQAERSLIKQDAADREVDFIAQTIANSQRWKTSLHDLRTMHAQMYNLLGDPATRLSLPAMGVKDITVKGGAVSGRVEGLSSGRVTVEIDTPRIEMANRDRLTPAIGDNDPDLETKAEHNYPLANMRLLIKAEGNLDAAGCFSIALPNVGGSGAAADLPKDAGVVRVRVTGTDAATGEQREVIGALRLP